MKQVLLVGWGSNHSCAGRSRFGVLLGRFIVSMKSIHHAISPDHYYILIFDGSLAQWLSHIGRVWILFDGFYSNIYEGIFFLFFPQWLQTILAPVWIGIRPPVNMWIQFLELPDEGIFTIFFSLFLFFSVMNKQRAAWTKFSDAIYVLLSEGH